MSETDSDILTSQIPPVLQRSQQIKTQLNNFRNKLKESGIYLSLEDDEPHLLTQEQALVVRDLEKYFENATGEIEGFMKGLKVLCKKEKYFRKALSLTRLEKHDHNISRLRQGRIEQESLFRIFLKVSCLQKEVMDLLLKEITDISESVEDTSMLHLLLNPFRFLPHIIDPQNLTTKLLDTLDIASYPAQLEIFDSIPDIIPDGQYSETAKQLCKLMDDNDELTGAIIDCLNVLDLDSGIRSDIQDRILDKIASGASLKIFPILLSFLMSDCKSQNCVQTLLTIRNALDKAMLSTDKSKDKESSKILIFNKLQAYTLSSKNIVEAWLNMISSIKSHSDHRPIDYLLLFMLHSTVTNKKRIIEVIIRKRVNNGLLKINQMEKMFEKYLSQQLLKDYFPSIVEIGCSLVRSSHDQIITEFSSTLFHTLFDHYYTETLFRREMLESLIVLTGSNDKKTVNTVLKIISSLLANSEKLQQHVVLLMRLLERLDSLELRDVKLVFEILCSLTCGPNADDSLSGLRDEIHMMIRKQLYSSKRTIKHRGIVSAVVMARNIVRTLGDETSPLPKKSIRSISDLPRGSAREAGSLLELATTCTLGCPELLGLYYDQLALMLVANHHLDQSFMAWLFETVTADFQNKYIGEISKQSENELTITMQYMLNRSEEMDSPEIGVNIAGLTLAKDPFILLLAPHFRLLRLLHYRLQDGDLSTVNALLGCAIALPEVEDIDDLDSDQVKQVADCLFHCANWFREIISGFVTQSKRFLRVKVVARLEHLLEIEKKLQLCLNNAPEHKLPVSYFDAESEKSASNTKAEVKPKNPKKKLKSAPAVADPDETANTSVSPSQSRKKKPVAKSVNIGHKMSFRDLDTDAVLLFKYPLKFPEDDCTQLTQTASLNIEQLEFLLKDLVAKLLVATQNKNVGLSHLNEVVPLHLIKDSAIHILPNLESHLEVIIEKINKLLDETDGRLDLPEMFSPSSLIIKSCFGLILEAFYLIFSWTGFQHSSNLEVLKTLLKSMKSTTQTQSLNSAHRLIMDFIKRLAGFTEQCLELSQAVNLVKLMQALYSLITPNSPETQKKIVSAAGKLLSKRWYNSKGSLDIGRSCILNIDVLVKVYLGSASVKTIAGLVGTLQEQVDSLRTNEDCLLMLSSIDKKSFHVLFNGLCSALLSRIKSEVQALTNSQHLVLWTNAALTMQGLMTIAKAQESKSNLACFLKKSIGILKIFLSHGIPIMELTLRSKPDDVVAIFKSLQLSTRFLHHLCCYTKFTKDASLLAYVPQFRLTLESLVYRVKAALAANNCSTAFWLGNLRNRDLEGHDILSQSTTVTEGDEEGTDEELPADDSDEDISEVDDSTIPNRSSSAVY
ncbi:hypothetical protein JTB14_015490 [Gonioctena quinquepunctata]|nr:hypothetical protein JTB14_015490 [Gonioctena quinquepunctata]